jgi:hypothetical protein
MADITTRAGKGSPLTNNEVDANFTNLNTDKAESGNNSDITSLAGISGGVGDADYVDFDLAATVARETGRLTWNNVDGCLEVGVIGSNVTQQLGQELLTRVYNAELNPIENGNVVYFHSTSEQLVAVKEFIADGTFDPHLVIGVTTETIPAGGYGYVCEFGLVRGLNTAAFNPGDIVYASPSVAGDIINIQPSPPNNILHLGICVESDSTDGIIWVNQHDVPMADEVTYNNADSSLLATNVKSAIDELDLTKADLDLLTSNVTFYNTNANDPVIAGYKQTVTSTVDPSFDETAVDYLISGITNTALLSQTWISDPNVLAGSVAGIVVPFVGNFRKDSGSGNARFYFEIYIRDDLGVETLLATSNTSDYITSTSYTQISLSATITLQEFTETDRVVLKLYAQTDSSTASYEIQLGGTSPFRALFPVPVSVVPSVALASNIVTDTTTFNKILSSNESSVQAALDVLDDHGHQLSDITGVNASNIGTTTTSFNGVLSVADDDVQKALNTLDDITLQDVANNGNAVTGNITVGSLSADNLSLDSNTISSTDVDGNISITPNGNGSVIIDAADIGGGFVDNTPVGSSVPDTGDFTTLSATSASFTTVTDLGSVTTADINGGTIDGVTLSATIANVDNIQIDSNAITSTNGNGNIALTPNGTGSVVISKVDIASGEIDGTAIGANAASTGAFTDLSASGTVNLTGATVSNLGSVTTADINGGTIDGTDITVGAGATLNVVNGTLSLADDQISGAKIDGGVISNFASTGVDDNAASTTVTINASNNVGLGLTDPDEKLEVNGDAKVGAAGDTGRLHLGLTSDETNIVGRGALHATLPSTLDVAFGGTAAARFSATGVNVVGNISVSGTVDSRDVNADGTKLDTIASGAQVNVGTNLSATADGTQLQVNSSTGNNVDLPAATTSAWGVMTDEDKTKLDGIEAGATASSDAAITSNGSVPSLATGITGAEVRSLIGAGTSSTTGTVTSVLGGSGLTGSVSTSGSLAVGAGTGIAVNANDVALSTAGPGAAVYGSTANGTKIDTITLDAYGRVSAIVTGPTGTSSTDTNTTYTLTAAQTGGTNANPNLFLNASSGSDYNVSLSGGVGIDVNRSADTNITFTIDLSELTDMTATMIGTDEFIVLDGGADRRKAASEIGNGIFSNTAGYITNANLGATATASSLTITSNQGTNASIPAATTSAWGAMTDEDKSKLNGIATGADVNVGTNLSQSRSASAFTVISSTGSNVSMPAATPLLWGMMTDNDKAKLDGIATGADVNVGTNISVVESATTVAINSSTGADDSIAAATTSVAGVMTGADKSKLNGIAASATNTAAPAITSNGSTPSLASGISAAEVRSVIGAAPAGGSLGTNWLANEVQADVGVVTDKIRVYSGTQLVLNAGESNTYATGQTSEGVYINAESGLTVTSSPDNWISGWAGRKTAVINNPSGDSSFPGNITVTGTVDGRDVSADGTKLDTIANGAQVNVGTNLAQSRTGSSFTVTSSTGSNVNLSAATTTLWGVMTDEDKSKLDGIAASATNTAAPAITTNGSTPSLASGITAAEVRSLIGAGTGNGNGDITGVTAGTGLYGGGASGSVTINQYSGVSVGGSATIADGTFRTVTSSGSIVTLPASPAAGDSVYISNGPYTNTTIAKNGQNIMGLAENLTLDVANIGITLIFADSTRGWRIM